MEDGKNFTLNGMWRALIKEEVADLPHHIKRLFKAVSLNVSAGHIRVPH